MTKNKKNRKRRHKRVRAKIVGTSKVPRLCVFRSLRHTYAQLIDDQEGKVLVEACFKELKTSKKQSKTDKAKEIGRLIARKAISKNIEKVVFDRGGYKYHGRVKALAEGAREEGLKF
jgi:large subunit ribosomal protein L18